MLGSSKAAWVPRPHPLLLAIFERKGMRNSSEMSQQERTVVVLLSGKTNLLSFHGIKFFVS